MLDDVTVELGSFADALPFIQAHYARIFNAEGNAGRFLGDPLTSAKRRFGDEMDVLMLRSAGATIGLLAAHPLDWSTYYMRTVALLPEFRDRRLLTRLMHLTYEPLRAAGVERIEGDCSPANTPMMRMLVNEAFLVTSTINSERWGSMLRFTKFLREEAQEVFARQYCALPSKASHPLRRPLEVVPERGNS